MKNFFILSLVFSLVFPSLSFAVELSTEEKSSQLASIIESIKSLINSLKKDQAAAIVLATNTFASKVNAELEALVNGPGKGDFNIYQSMDSSLGGALKINTNSWTSKLDFTGVMTWQDEWKDARKAGTLIAPSFMIQADHLGFGFYPGRIVRFADKEGKVEERTVVDYRVVPGTDIHITKLNSPLPAGRFKAYRVFSSMEEFNLKNSFDEIPFANGPYGQTNNLKFLAINQNRSVIVHQANGNSSALQVDIWDKGTSGCSAKFGAYENLQYPIIRNHDSGGPSFVLVNGELILVSAHQGGGLGCVGGPFVSGYINEINSAMSDMGSTERLSTISLNSIGSFIDANHTPQFVKRNYKVQINEKTPVGTVVAKIEARDINPGQTLVYSIIGGSGANYFSINSTTGQITVKDSVGLDFNSPTLRSLAGISPTNDLAIPSLNLDIKITDNGNPSKSNSLIKSVTAIEGYVQIEILKQGTAMGAKSLAIDPLRRTQISATTPLMFVYKVSNWPVSSVNVSLVPFNSDGVEIRGGVYPLPNGSLINIPVINSKRSGSESYTEEISQDTINSYESRARLLGSRMPGGLKLPVKYKVKICGAGTDSTLCAISNETFTFLNPVVSTPSTDPAPSDSVPENIAPVLNTIGSKTVAENNQLTFTLSATDANSGDVLTYSATNLPSGATFNANTRVFAFSPSFAQSGSYSPTFTVSDAKGGIDTETVSINVTNTNRAPVIVSSNDQIINTSSVNLSAVGSNDPDGGSINYSWSKLSGPGTVTFSSATTASTNATFSANGMYVIRLTVSDGVLSTQKNISIAVDSYTLVRRNTDSDGDGKNDELDYCPNTPIVLKTESNTFGCLKPKISNFDIRPNLERNLNTVKGLEIGKSGVGKILFNTDVALTRNTEVLDVDSNLTFSSKKVSLDSSDIPELNKPATITLYNLTEKEPKILKDGVECKSPQCVINSYSNGTLVFTVTGFSTYEITEGAIEDSADNSSNNSGGSSGGGGTRSSKSKTDNNSNLTKEQLIESIKAQLLVLIAEYNRVKALEDAQNGVTSNEDVLKGFQFTKTFGVGTTDKEVRYLQRFLNTHGFPVGSGLGSYGKEVDTFGPVTKATLIKYQLANGIEGTGYFGNLTKAKVNQILLSE